MPNSQPTTRERAFLRAIAAVNPDAFPGHKEWWSADHLRSTALFPDFRNTPVLQIGGLGKSCTRRGMAVRRYVGTRGHGWAEWRISSYGRGLVSDSCIGGGLPWKVPDDGPPSCPACNAPAGGLPAPAAPFEVPAHPLPGHAATATGD